MLATLTGDLCLLVGLAVLLLPLLATELSRPRDGAWGAVVLLMGLVLVTSSDRLRGAPMLAVACGALLISRLGIEVAQSRWHQLSPEEQQRLSSRERWATSLQQLVSTLMSFGGSVGSLAKTIQPSLPTNSKQPKREGASKTGKRWVRPESDSPPSAPAPDQKQAAVDSKPAAAALDTQSAEAPQQAATASSGSTISSSPIEPNAAKDEPSDHDAGEQAQTLPNAEPVSKGFGPTKTKPKGKGKRWVRPEPDASSAAAPTSEQASQEDPPSISAEGTGEDR